ncbi:MAG: DUF2953 domain-containing protein [Ignavibacteriales bacterium]
MSLLFFILIILVLLILIIFSTVIKVFLTVNSGSEELNIKLVWLDPFLKIAVEIHNYVPLLKISIFNKNIIKKELKKGNKKALRLQTIKEFKFKDINIDTSYGFKDPSITGITCGAINAASALINIKSLSQKPDFNASDDYIHVNADAKLNVGLAFVNLFKSYRK